VFFQILYRLGHPLGSERVKKGGILRAMFQGSDFKYFFQILYRLGHPLGSERVKRCGILRAMFQGSDCKASVFSNFVSTRAPSRFREGEKMWNFEGQDLGF
jgi:hypothetical protein